MKTRAGILALVFSVLGTAPASAATISVNTTADQYGTGSACSLREAVTAANGNAAFGGCSRAGRGGTEVILLSAGRQYQRSITGPGDDNTGGDLDVLGDLTIRPRQDHGRAMIDAAGISRVIDVLGPSKLTVSRVDLIGGDPLPGELQQGAGVQIAAGARLTLSRSTLTGNQIAGPGEGAGIENQGTLIARRVRLAGNTITSNGAANGGGLDNAAGAVATLDRAVITGNDVSNVGGGIDNAGGKMTITDSTISGNIAGYTGGGLSVSGSGSGLTTIADSTVAGNSALGDTALTGGGGIEVANFGNATVRLTNDTVSGNSAAGVGGGMVVYAGGISAVNVTVAFNTGDSNANGTGGGGGVAGSVFFSNSIIAGNRDLNPGAKHPDCFNAVSSGHSLIGDPASCATGPTDITGRAPRLAPLDFNGGPTKTHMPSSSSPAIGRGSTKQAGKAVFTSGACARHDQRGVRRPQGRRCDIGAVERRTKGKP